MESKILISIDEELKKRIRKSAKDKGLSISAYIRMLMIENLKEEKSEN